MKKFLDLLDHNYPLFNNLFNSIQDLVLLMEVEGDSFRYVYINKSAKVIFNNENITGHLLEEVLPMESATYLISKYQEAVKNKVPTNFEKYIRYGSSEFIGKAAVNPLLTDDGKCDYVLVTVRNITKIRHDEKRLKKTRKYLERSHKILKSIIENDSDAVFELDLNGNFIGVNERTLEITGYKKEELVGHSILLFIVEENLEESIANFKKTLKGELTEYQSWIKHQNGNRVLINVKNIPIIVDGELEGVYGIGKDITEEQKLKQQLKESEQRYKSLFEHHPDAIFTFDLEGNFTSGNDSVEKIAGYSKEEFLGKSFIPMIVPEDVMKTLYNSTKAIKEKKAQNYEITIIHKKGHYVDLFVTSIPMIVDDEIIGIYGIGKDITDFNRAQKELVETKEKLDAFWDSTGDPIFFLSEGKIFNVNPAFKETFGFSKEEILENSGLIIPLFLESEETYVNETINKGESITFYETNRITKSGEMLDIIATYTPLKDEKDNIVGAIGFYKDITYIKKKEKELRKSEQQFRLLSENAFDIIKLISPSGIVEYVSPSYQEIVGYPREEYVGKHYSTYFHPGDISKIKAEYEGLMNEGKTSTIEVRIRHKDGYWIWVESAMSTIYEDGKIKQFVTISRDITERKLQQETLEKMAFQDPLTGLGNRRVFYDRLDEAIEEARVSGKKVAVMFLDGKKLKQVNDTYGHDTGDALIKEFANRLKKCVRPTDTVARLGGDEFGVILPNIDSKDVSMDVAKRLLEIFEEDPLIYKNEKIPVEAGIGISIYPDHTDSKEELVEFADQALYGAKEADKSDFKLYE